MRSRICALAITLAFVAAGCDSSGGNASPTSQIGAGREDPTTTGDTTPTTSTTASTSTTLATTTTAAPPSTAAPTTEPPATTAAPPPPPAPPNTVGAGSTMAGCPAFPADNYWHADVSALPRLANSDAYIASIGASAGLKADFGSGLWDGGPIGIPFIAVGAGQAKVAVNFDYADESDPGPYPIPSNAPIEGGAQADGDRHILVVDASTCYLYELFSAYPASGGSWNAGSGAIYDLHSNALRPAGWTSADAAGLPILPGLVRYDEVAAGVINHALFYIEKASGRGPGHVFPAQKGEGSSGAANAAPDGTLLQLDPSLNVDALALSPWEKTVARALQRYGMYQVDGGGNGPVIYAENPINRGTDPYAGLPIGMYGNLWFSGAFPWNRMRVLQPRTSW